ncbi:MAG: YbaK/EbsC family protein [Pseudomonadota bacterium]
MTSDEPNAERAEGDPPRRKTGRPRGSQPHSGRAQASRAQGGRTQRGRAHRSGGRGPDRFKAAAGLFSLPVEVTTHEATARTAAEAATTIGCSVAQIVKSLVFRGAVSGEPVLLLVSGANIVDADVVARAVGEPIERAEASWVRGVTGYAIGGIPPFGHARAIATWMDEALLDHLYVWAAAGAPDTTFRVIPDQLVEVTGAHVICVTQTEKRERRR